MMAQQKIKVRINPVDSFAQSQIPLEKLSFNVADSFSAIKKLKKFSDEWINTGYLVAGFDSISFDSLLIEAYFYLGNRYLWDNLKLDNTTLSILKKTGHRKPFFKKKSLNYHQFLQLREDIVNYYEEIGYPFAEVKIDSLRIDNQEINGRLQVEPHTFVRIDSILIKGNIKTAKKYLFYYFDIKRGEPYNQSKIDNLEKSVEELPFLKIVRPPEIEFREGKADVYLYLKNQPANYFNGIIGFASGTDENPDFQITGDLNLVLLNAFKIGEQLEIYWDKSSANSQNLRLGFQFPYLFFLPVGVDFHFGLEKYDVDYLNTSLYGGLEYSFSAKNKMKAYISQNKSYVINNESNVSSSISNSSRFIAGLTFHLDKTDYRFNPQKGFFIEASSGYGTRNNSSLTSGSLIEINLDLAYYLKMGRMGIFAVSGKSAGLYANEPFFENELYKIGGINTLRGFDEKSILASSYAILSLEPRLLLDKNSALYLFYDMAWYESKQINMQFTDTPIGFGIGINIDTKAGIFKLNYALGKQFDNPIKFSDSKVHLGFSARF